MASLEDFAATPSVTLDDVKVQSDSTPLSNKPSIANLSAQSAVLGDNARIEALYRQISSELSNSDASISSNKILEDVRNKSFAASEKALVDFLSNPEYTEEQKKVMAESYYDARTNQMPKSSQDLISENAVIQPSDNETIEAEEYRIDIAGAIQEINDYKKTMQSMINAEAAKNDAGLLETGVEFMELMVPFLEGAQFGTIVSDFKNAKTAEEKASVFSKSIALLGSSKAEFRDAMLRLPPDKRLEVSQSIIDIINNHSGLVVTDSNDLARMEYLRTGLQEGYYSDTDKWIDNAISILDLTIIGTVAGKVIKGVKGAGKARAARKLDDEAVRQFKEEYYGAQEVDDATVRAKFEELFQNRAGVEDAEFEEFRSKVRKGVVRSEVQPTTVSQNYKDTNPTKGRIAHEAAVKDETGEAAEVLYGSSSNEAIANDLLPEVGNNSGSVRTKLPNPGRIDDQASSPNADVMDFVNWDGKIYYSKAEKERERSRVVNDFRNAVGMSNRAELSSVLDTPDGVKVSMVYGPSEGGFKDPWTAVEVASFSLRDYGVKPRDVKVMKRAGGEWVEIDPLKELKDINDYNNLVKSGAIQEITPPSNSYLVRVDHDYKFNPADVVEWSELDVKRNLFDYMRPLSEQKSGSVNQHIFDAHSSLHPTLTQGANIQVDKAVGLEKLLSDYAKEFGTPFSKLPKARRDMVDNYLREANEQGISFSKVGLKARGFTDHEINIVKKWNDTWDTIYWMENKDLGKSLTNRGYKVFWDKASNTRLFAKPVARNQTGDSVKYFDQRTGKIERMGRQEISDLYKAGGEVAQLRQPMEVGGESVAFVKVENAVSGSYMRAITDQDKVLNYRPGYFTVRYKNPRFVIKRVKDKNGNITHEKAVANAGSVYEAETIAKRMAATDGGDYFVRGDVKGEVFSRDNDMWDVEVSLGRTAQRVRGKRLEGATSPNTNMSDAHIVDPVESLTQSIRSIARRTSMRDYIDSSKKRFIAQFKDHLPTNDFGQPIWPNSVKDIGKPGAIGSKAEADARTTYNYIRYIEEGYVNAIDDAYKATLNAISDAVSGYSSTAEKAAQWAAEKSPTRGLKSAAFKMYLASNPIRQFVVQGHQAVQLTAKFPKYMVSGKLPAQMYVMAGLMRGTKPGKAALKAAGLTSQEAQDMYQAFRRSGMSAAVDANNLVRGDLQSIADMTFWGRTKKAAAWPLRVSQKVGFDAGEQMNIMSAWLAFRNEAISSGKALNAETWDEIGAAARNYTYNMNAAGDLPYNQNALNTVFQFLQVPHKSLTQWTTNRVLSKKDKARIAVFNTAMYGIPSYFAANYFYDILPEDQETRRLVEYGLESMMLNKLLSLASGDKTEIDWSGLAPTDVHGMAETLMGMWTLNPLEIISESPSGQLLFGNNPRITNAFKSAARYFSLIEDHEEAPTTFYTVAKDFAKLSSGMSNAFKATYAYETGRKLNSAGTMITDTDVNTMEALATALGFRTQSEAENYRTSQKIYESSKAYREDIESWYKDFKKALASSGHEPDDLNNTVRTYSEAWRVWGSNPAALDIINTLLTRDVSNGDWTIFNSALRSMNMIDPDTLRTIVKESAMDETKRNQLMETIDRIESYEDN